MTDIQTHKEVIVIALMDGIRTARKAMKELRQQDQTLQSAKEIREYQELINDLADALHWLTGDELEEMQRIYEQVKQSPRTIK